MLVLSTPGGQSQQHPESTFQQAHVQYVFCLLVVLPPASA